MILIAGGTGTLGRKVVHLLHERGHRVRVLTRDRERAAVLPTGIEVATGDLRDPGSLEAAVADCEAVVAAAHGFTSGTTEAIDDAGNRALFAAAAAAGVGRIVLVSVHGASASHPMALHRAKLAAEQALRAGTTPYVIVRPTAFLETWIGVIGANLERRGQALVLGPGRNPINFVSADDVATVVVAAACGEISTREIIELGGPENLDFVSFARRLIAASGRDARIRHVPLPALRAMAVLARPFSRGFAERARAAVVMNTKDMTCSGSARARTRLDDLLSSRMPDQPAAQHRRWH